MLSRPDNNKILLVGDLHPVPEELKDCSALIDRILGICRSEEVFEVWFSGDQHHTNNVVRLEVINWWMATIKAFRDQGIRLVFIPGNHDQEFPGSDLNAMIIYRDMQGVLVADKPTLHRGVLLLPYYHEESSFQAACQAYPEASTVFCHQTFNGSTYENGFLAKDGFSVDRSPQRLVISGHIHTPQEWGKVWYIGAPRWRTLSDANVERSVWLLELGVELGVEPGEPGETVVKNRIPFDTGAVCRQIRALEDTPDKPVELPLEARHQWHVTVRGPLDWCNRRKVELQAAGARVRTLPDQVSTVGRVRESQGIDVAFREYQKVFVAPLGTPADVLQGLVGKRL
jgi:DNA repair exonuclease SbcCD nuclease subunit